MVNFNEKINWGTGLILRDNGENEDGFYYSDRNL